MRVGIDVRVLGSNKALERYTRNLVTQLLVLDKKNKYVLLVDDRSKVTSFKNADVFFIPPKKVLTDHLRFSRLIKSARLDVVFHPDNTEFLNCHPNSIVTLHDVIPWKFPQLILSQNPLLKARQVLYFKLQETALRKATKIITVSENSKNDISEILGISPEKIAVIYEGVEGAFAAKAGTKVLKKLAINNDYIFYIGGFSPHKNVLSLIRAFALLEDKQLLLVLGGKSDETKGGRSAFREIQTEIIKNNLTDRVIFTDFLADSDLVALYQQAAVFVFPSLYEGFGFPPLEAMKAGVPVVSSSRASLGEILKDGVYRIDDPQNPPLLADAIRKVLEDKTLNKTLRAKGQKIADSLNWEKTALETIRVLESTLR